MTIPRFWAEAHAQHREKGRQVTIRRYGWSTQSQAEAQAMAEARVAEAMRRVLAGEKLIRREPKVAYNGAEGVPIREEIVAEHGDCVITRNSYGALCLNTPDALFADVDFAEPVLSWKLYGWILFALLFGVGVGVVIRSPSLIVGSAILVVLHEWLNRRWRRTLAEKIARRAEAEARTVISEFVAVHANWRLRLYRTPAGFRVLAMHQLFQAGTPETAIYLQALKCDPVYVQMCQRQQCFRARVSPKPWRIGISDHLRPRPGIWPVREEAMPLRRAWVNAYQAKAAGFAACRFESELGQGPVHEKVRAVQELHDRLCRADSGLPIA